MKSNYIKQGISASRLIIISVITLFTFSTCDKDELTKEESNKETTTIDNYYVKYVIIGNGAYGRFSNWTATIPQGIYTNNGYQTRSWSQTYGPVQKGFKCEVKIGNYISGAPTIEIHVSKNSEPFALKTTINGELASHTIN